jgi:hypothetical protein
MERLETDILLEAQTFGVSRGRFLRASGELVEREVVEHPGSVGILAHDDEVVYLVRQPREVIGEALPGISDAKTLVALLLLQRRLSA